MDEISHDIEERVYFQKYWPNVLQYNEPKVEIP